MKMILIISSVISCTALFSIWGYFGWLYLKAWLFDKGMPRVENTRVAKIVDRFGIFDPLIDPLLCCVVLWVILLVVGGLLITGLWKLAILAIFVVAGLHALRWGIRAGKAINKVKSMLHKHDEGE